MQIAEFFDETAPLFPAGPPQFVTEPVPYFIRELIQAVNGVVNFRQIPRGNVIASSTPRTSTDPVTPRAPVPPFKTLNAFKAMVEAAPQLRHAQIIRVWSGVEGYLPDMLPVIGPSSTTPGLFHAFGCSGHGFQIGPGVGLCLSEMIVDGSTSTPLEPFYIDRFKAPAQESEKLSRAVELLNRIKNNGFTIQADLLSESGPTKLWEEAVERAGSINALVNNAGLRTKTSIGGGQIINVASRAGQRGHRENAMPYGASKAGLINLTKSTAVNFGHQGIV